MKETKTLGRREFTAASAMALLSGVAITISACGGDSSPSNPSAPAPTPNPTPAPPAGGGDVNGAITANHGHTAVVTAAQLTAGAGIMLDITGSSNHPHTVELTDADITAIAGGTQVSRTSTNNAGHAHTVTFN